MVQKLAQIAIALLIVIGIIGVLYLVINVAGLPVPHWVVSILIIVGAVVLGVWAIKYMAGQGP